MDKPHKKDCVTRFCEWMFRCEKNRAKSEAERLARETERRLVEVMDLCRELSLKSADLMLAGQQIKLIGENACWGSSEPKRIIKDCVSLMDAIISVYERTTRLLPVEAEMSKAVNAFEWSRALTECSVNMLHSAAVLQEEIFACEDTEKDIAELKVLRDQAVHWL